MGRMVKRLRAVFTAILGLMTRKRMQRISALFFVSVMFVGTLAPLGPWAASVSAAARDNKPVGEKVKPLASAKALTQPLSVGSGAGASAENVPQPDGTFKNPSAQQNGPKERAYEDTSARTATSKVWVNKDGTRTLSYSPIPQHFQKDGKWEDINKRTDPDNDYHSERPIENESLVSKLNPLDNEAQALTASTADLVVKLRPYADGLEVNIAGKKFAVVPAGASNVRPIIKTYNGQQVIEYIDAWPGVDVNYEIVGASLKETIVIKRQGTQNVFVFELQGATARPNPNATDKNGLKGSLSIDGIDPDKFILAPLSVNMNGRGVITEDIAKQVTQGKTVAITLDGDWLSKQPESSFPVAIDPIFTNGVGGTYGNFYGFKSDGYSCNSTNCDPQAGALYDNGWKNWRTLLQIPLGIVAGKHVQNATMHLVKKTRSYYTGTTDGRTVALTPGSAWGYGCQANVGYSQGPVWTHDWINVTNTIRWMAANDPNGYQCFWGEEGAYESYKGFEPNDFTISVEFYDYAPTTSPVAPADKQVVVTNQPALRVNPVTDPNANGYQVKYYFRVSTSPDAETGAVINSGYTTSTQWTVPEGVLQDGTTYYWHAYTWNGITIGTSPPSAVRSFKVDLRTGKDSTQAYDTAGPMSVDLATGNGTTSIATHGITALGGTIGLGLDYNTPSKSVSGLTGEYYNLPANTWAIPTTGAVLSRVDPAIDFDYAGGSPGGSVASDWFGTRWTGYFVAPTTDTYYFGGSDDDALRIWVNDQQLYSQDCYHAYGGTPCYNGSIALTAGQVVPIKVEYVEGTYGAYVRMWAKTQNNTVAEQVVPTEWLRTAPRQTGYGNGLNGRYYTDDGSHTFPTNESDPFRFLLARTDTSVNFNWGNGGIYSTAPVDNFMARWRGYVIVPTSGTYTFGASADDGVRIKILTTPGSAETNALDQWTYVANDRWPGVNGATGNSVSLTANTAYPITIEYYESGYGASFTPKIKGPGLLPEGQEIPGTWFVPGTNTVPAGWGMSVDPDGDVAYERLRQTQTSVILTDSTGQGHEYTYVSGGYKPPANEDGILTRNEDNTFKLQDTDGRIYIFSAEGILTSLTSPQDDKQPAALKYEYAGSPAKLVKISDGADPSRYGQVWYAGDSQCSVPSGFDSTPTGMLCAFTTTDGSKTSFYYKDYRLSRIEKPGSEITDFSYDSLGRIAAVRDALAADAIAAGVRTDDDTTKVQIGYDAVGRINGVTMPAATTGATRQQKTYEYIPGSSAYWSAVEELPGVTPTGSPALVNWGGNKIAMFARIGSELQYRFYENGTWTAWQSLGGCMLDDPAAASWGDGRIDVFVRGCDNVLWTRWYENGQWSAFTSLGGTTISSSPSAVSWSKDRYDVVARGPNNELLQRFWSPSTSWSPFYNQGGCLSGAPSVSTWGVDRLNVYLGGCDSPSSLYQKYWAPNWTDYTTLLGEKITSAPQSVSTVGNKIHIATRGTAGDLRYLRYDGVKWDNPQSVQSCITGSPAITQNVDQTTVVYKGCDGKLYQTKRLAAVGTTKMHVTGDTEPNGYSDRVDYDSLYRTTKNYDKSGQYTQTEWDPVKDLQLSSTDPTGLKSTTIYDADDKPMDSYGPAPSAWFGADRKPLTAYVNQVPHTQTNYDEGISGPAIAYHNFKSANKTLVGAPKLHTTGIDPNDARYFSHSWGNAPPITVDAGMDGWGLAATAKLTVPTAGTYTFRIWHDDGARLYVDDKLVIDDWVTGANRSKDGTLALEANKPYRFKLDYFDADKANASLDFSMRLGGGPVSGDNFFTGAIQIKPDYNLTTSTKVFDSQAGDITTTTSYGTQPELGQAQSSVIDPTGLNLLGSATYEPYQNGSLLRQTGKTLPGGNSYAYQYYGATESRANPCDTNSTAVSQAGRPKGKTEPDPDGVGSQTSRTTETVYDAAGRVIATRLNSDSWTCTTYDTRGRVTQTVVPTINGRVGRTVTNSYAVNGNPLVTSQTDSITGTMTTVYDLLGRVVTTTDTFGYQATTTYDNLGRVSQRTSLAGSEVPTYDNLDRVTSYALDGVTYATITYDQYSRVAGVEYPQAQTGGDKLTLSQIRRDNLQRVTGSTFTFSNATTFEENVTLNQQRGIVTGYTGTFNGLTAGATYQYDKAGRMTQATVDTMRYQYAFGAQDAACASLSGYNANAHKNSHRTAYTVTNLQTSASTTTNNCYNNADQLISSADTQIGAPTYDDHGNTTQLAGSGTPITFTYDAMDANTAITQGNNKVEYTKSVSGAVLTKKEYRNNMLDKVYRYAAGVLITCDVANQSSCSVVDKYVSLPGGVSLTLKATGNVYSVKNFHGDTALTVNDAGIPTSSVYLYDPFGQPVASTAFSTSGDPNNSSNEGMGWAASPGRKVESLFSIPIIQMGARVYLPSLGRFLQVDPIEGGMANAYVYALDPISGNDYSGMALSVVTYSGMQGWSGAAALLQSAALVAVYQPAAPASRVQTVGGTISRSSGGGSRTTIRVPARSTPTPPSWVAAAAQLADPKPSVHPVLGDMSKLPPGKPGPLPAQRRAAPQWNWINAGSSAKDYYTVGKYAGGAMGCGVGALLTIEAAGFGCAIGAPIGGFVVGSASAAWGYVAGGYGLPGANLFDGVPDIPTWW